MLQLKNVIEEISRHDSLSTQELRNIIRHNVTDNLGHSTLQKINNILRELIRFSIIRNFGPRRSRYYRLTSDDLSKVEEVIRLFQKHSKKATRTSPEEILNRLAPRKIFSREELDKEFCELRIDTIDRMISRLKSRGIIRALAGPRTRANYEILPASQWGKKKVDFGQKLPIDRIAVALSLGGDNSILCYSTAMELHGLSRYDVLRSVYISGGKYFKSRQIDGIIFSNVKRPVPELGKETLDHHGKAINASNLERTLIDIIHKPRYAGGTENVLHALSVVKNVDTTLIIEYLEKLHNPNLNAKCGYIISCFMNQWQVQQDKLDKLRNNLPKASVYLFKHSYPTTLITSWKVRVPIEAMNILQAGGR